MIFSQRREHCLWIDQQVNALGLKSGLLIGGPDYAKTFAETRQDLENGKLRVGIGTVQAIGQGLDIPKIAVAIVTTPIASNRQLFGQVRGRVCRTAKGKDKARLYYFWDRGIYGLHHVENIVRWNKQVRVLGHGPEMQWVSGRTYLDRLRGYKSKQEVSELESVVGLNSTHSEEGTS
jgi:hypothetical protein